MFGLASILAMGLVVGLRHATDTDHVLAVSTIVSRRRSGWGAALIGAYWGLGHSLTILCVGGAMILLKWSIPERLSNAMEWSVGVMLVLLGLWNVLVSRSRHTHRHEHSLVEIGVAGSMIERSRTAGHGRSWNVRPFLRPLVVGMVHGLAGSAAIALLILATIPDVSWALAYLSIFAVGTIVGMMTITWAIAIPFKLVSPSLRLDNCLRVVSGLACLGFGLLMVYQYSA